MARRMTEAEYLRFLAEGTRTAKVSVTRADGRPHVAPVWFTLDGGDVIFTTWHTTVKARSLARDSRVCLCVDDERAPFAYVIVEGTTTLSEDPEALLRWATVIAGRYMGAEQAETFGRRNGVPGELLVRVTPTKIIAESGVAE
ncbi:MAG TPA: PPOX class F420-dependent oxidoreductase [Ktedonobacterales bacterium]